AETAMTIPRLEAGIRRGIVALRLTICEPCFGTRAMFQEDKDMADQNEAKTKTIGFLPIEKVQTLRGWEEYVDKSAKLSALRTEAQKAKNSVRDALKERLSEDGDMDFAVEGDRIRVSGSFASSSKGGGPGHWICRRPFVSNCWSERRKRRTNPTIREYVRRPKTLRPTLTP